MAAMLSQPQCVEYQQPVTFQCQGLDDTVVGSGTLEANTIQISCLCMCKIKMHYVPKISQTSTHPSFFFFRANHSVTGLEITLSCTRFVSPCILLWCEELFYSWNILYLWICMHFMRMMLLFAVWYVDIKMYFMIAKVLIYCMYFYKDVLNFNHCYGWGWMDYWMCLNLVMPDEEKLGGFCQQSAYTWNCYVCILLMFSVYNYNGAKSVVISVDIT